MSSGSALEKAIASIDELIEKLKSGALLGGASTAAQSAPSSASALPPIALPAPAAAAAKQAAASKPAKEKTAKPAKAGNAQGAVEGPELLAKAHLAVARVIFAEPHPNSDKLYITKLDIGGGAQRQIVAGLQKYITVDALQGSKVVVVLNLKPAKLAGELSEGMILAASAPCAEGEDPRVYPLQPDAAAEPGDMLYLESQEPPADTSGFPKQLKGDHWRKIVSGLAVKEGAACFEGVKLVTTSGKVAAADMRSTIS